MKISVSGQINRWLARGLFLVWLCMFVAAATRNLSGYFPYDTFDEYYVFQVAMEFMKIFSGQGECVNLLSLPADGREPFLMYFDYAGWPALYIAVAVMFVLGKSLGLFFAFRLSQVLCAVLTLCSIWFVLRRWFDEWTGTLAVFFVGCNCSYIQSVRHAFYRAEIFQVCCLWFGTALCLAAERRKNSLFLYAGFFVFGIALWAKIMFIAYIVGAAAVFLAHGRKRRDFFKTVFPSLKSALFSGLAFLVGAAPFLWFNLRHSFPTFRLIFSRMFHLSAVNHEWNNSAVFDNFVRRIHDFYLYLSSQVLFELDASASVVYVSLFVCALVWGCAVVFGRWLDSGLRLRLRVLFVFYSVVLLLTCFLPGKHNSGHILMLVPFAGILCAVFLVRITRVRGLLFVPVIVCGLWFNEQLDHLNSFSQDYIQEGKLHGLLKGEPESLTVWLKSKNINSILCSDPVGYVLNSMKPELGMDFRDMGYCPSEPEVIARRIRLFIESMHGQKAYVLICSGKDFDQYTKVRDSARQGEIAVRIADIKTFRRKPSYTFVLCRVYITTDSLFHEN